MIPGCSRSRRMLTLVDASASGIRHPATSVSNPRSRTRNLTLVDASASGIRPQASATHDRAPET